MSINFFDFIIMTEREFRQNGENQSGRDGRKSYNNREGYNRNTTLDLIIMVANASSVVAMVIIIMVVNNVLTAIVRMEIMKEENVLTVHHVSITMAVIVSSVSLLQDLTMTVENNARSVLVRDNREDIVSRVEAMEIIVKAVSVRVQLTIIRMLNIA